VAFGWLVENELEFSQGGDTFTAKPVVVMDKKPNGKSQPKGKKAGVAPPLKSASGAGFTFEDKVAAILFCEMLAGKLSLGTGLGVIERIERQAGDWEPFGDILVTVKNLEGKTARCGCSVKSNRPITAAGCSAELCQNLWNVMAKSVFARDVDTFLGDVEREFWSAAELRVPAGKKIHMKGAAEQVVELFRAPASVGCCSGATKIPTLRQRDQCRSRDSAISFTAARSALASAPLRLAPSPTKLFSRSVISRRNLNPSITR
jgi:hypothetical protein